ncbi:MAG: UDP-N-acetylmuramoyl-tripeptide--D-alanyl-D-alanine ligase [Actinobacteria bacterium]|nr:MAG: UDP-N-acetylmuramoyl-tripeptide--D-alanyl-D-alanine ligase [Actinomycetota bacterium]
MSPAAAARSTAGGMIRLAWEEIEALGLGRLTRGQDDGAIVAVRADSRTVGPGELFVALNTGVAYVEDASGRGAATLVPDDQHSALASLASLVRSKSSARVVAIVGSTGKTTTKDILGALCAAAVPTVYPAESLNNEIGLPLTVCGLERETEVLVTEMGMRGRGQIAELCAIARPTHVLVTSIGPEHLELVGSIDEVARANAEAIDALPAGGVAVVPAGVPELERCLTRTDIEVERFDAAGARMDGNVAELRLDEQIVRVTVPFTQQHFAENLLAALIAYRALGLPLERVQEGASRIRLSRWRGEETALPGGGFVINDAYNANPTSMGAALRDLSARAQGRRRVAVLGEMAELGEQAAQYHRDLGEVVAGTVDVLVAVGELARLYMQPGVADMHWLEAPEGLESILRPGDAVLVKASRAVGLEGVPARIAKLAEAWSAS